MKWVSEWTNPWLETGKTSLKTLFIRIKIHNVSWPWLIFWCICAFWTLFLSFWAPVENCILLEQVLTLVSAWSMSFIDKHPPFTAPLGEGQCDFHFADKETKSLGVNNCSGDFGSKCWAGAWPPYPFQSSWPHHHRWSKEGLEGQYASYVVVPVLCWSSVLWDL